MIARRKKKVGPRIDYTALEAVGGLAKTGTRPADRQAERRDDDLDVQRAARRAIDLRQRSRCYAEDVSPVCRKVLQDPHHLLRRSQTRGMPPAYRHATRFQVGLCRPCHREADARVGGVRLRFEWDGDEPNADKDGHVRPVWVG